MILSVKCREILKITEKYWARECWGCELGETLEKTYNQMLEVATRHGCNIQELVEE
jgi:hypothetical protein